MAIEQFSRSLPLVLYRALDAVMPRFRAIFNDFGITEQQWRVLRVLWDLEDTAFGELARLTLIPAPSLVGVVDRLEAAGFVKRERSSSDRRQVRVQATAKGRELIEKILPRVANAYADLKRCVDGETWDGVLDGLESIAEQQKAATKRP